MIILEMVLNDLVQRYDITIFFDELKMKEAIFDSKLRTKSFIYEYVKRITISY